MTRKALGSISIENRHVLIYISTEAPIREPA